MRKPGSVDSLEKLGRTRLSDNFYMRDFLYSEIANFYGIQNIPDNPPLAIAAGTRLCQELLEPLQRRFGPITIRSAFRSCAVNQLGNERGHNCASNEANYASHIWDRLDADERMGATACIVVNSFVPYYEKTAHWQAIAWWVHDHLPYASMEFFPTRAAFNLRSHDVQSRSISQWIERGPRILTKPGMSNHAGSHELEYRSFLTSQAKG